MNKTGLIFTLALVLITPLCMNMPNEEIPEVEKRFQRSILEHNQSLKEVGVVLNSGGYEKVRIAIGKYNMSVLQAADDVTDLCADPKMSKKYEWTCSNSELINRCNKRDVAITSFLSRKMYNQTINKEECNAIVALIYEQDECGNVSDSFIVSQANRENLKKVCQKI
jgi:hypothetical protein